MLLLEREGSRTECTIVHRIPRHVVCRARDTEAGRLGRLIKDPILGTPLVV